MAKVKKKAKGKTPAGAKGQRVNGALTRKGIERARYPQKLPVPVGSDVVEKAGHEMARIHKLRAKLADEKTIYLKACKEKEAGYKQRTDELADTVNNSTALEDVEVVEYLIAESNEIRVYRTDTGEELVDKRRTAEAKDRQESLGVDTKPRGRAKAGAQGTLQDDVPGNGDDGGPNGDFTAEQLRGRQATGDARPGDGG